MLLIATGIIVRNTLVTYDRENERIGFWKTNCSELWDRLNLSPPPPSPSPSTPVHSGLDNPNSTAHMSPSPAPGGPPGYDIPGMKRTFLHIVFLLEGYSAH